MIDREFFYTGWRKNFGKLNQPVVNEVNFLLDNFDNSPVFDTKGKIAYGFSTIKRETAETFAPVNEGYWITSNRVSKLYSYYKINNPGALKTIFPNGINGINYLGRGYVQVTHDFNAKKLQNLTGIPFFSNPDLLLKREYAFKAMELGMWGGIFTGKKLTDYFNETRLDFLNARKIINGLDAAREIAANAEIFFKIIKFK